MTDSTMATIERTERPDSGLKLLHGTQISLEKARIQVGNRVSALERDADWTTSDIGVLYAELHAALEGWEERLERAMAREASAYPVWDAWLSHVRGIGPGLASQLLAMLLPPLPDRGPSTWFKAAGLTVEQIDGVSHLPRARVGQEGLSYYPRLRRCLFNVATSFVRVGGYYRAVYETRKARLVAQHAGDVAWPPYRLDSVARWVMVKLFLSHMYEKMLESDGHVGRRAYVLDVLGHTQYQPPPEWDGQHKM